MYKLNSIDRQVILSHKDKLLQNIIRNRCLAIAIIGLTVRRYIRVKRFFRVTILKNV